MAKANEVKVTEALPAGVKFVEVETSMEKNGPKVSMKFKRDALIALARSRSDADDLLIHGFKVAVLQNAIRGLMKAGIEDRTELLDILDRKLVTGIKAIAE